MKRVYRLLRDNLESGPFTIDELLGQQLRADDMLWIEGRSTAWCYLSEIELLPSVEQENLPVFKKDDIETRADEIRKKVMNYKPQNLSVKEVKGEFGERHYYIPISPIDTIEMVDHRKPRKSTVSDLVMTFLIIGLFAGGFLGGRSLFMNKKQQSSVSPATIRNVSKDEHAAKSVMPLNIQPTAATTTVDSNLLTSLTKPKSVSAKKPFDSNRLSQRITAIALHERTVRPSELKDDTSSAGVENSQPNETKEASQELVKEIKPVKISDDASVKDDAAEKNRGLFKKIFGKKKKNAAEEN